MARKADEITEMLLKDMYQAGGSKVSDSYVEEVEYDLNELEDFFMDSFVQFRDFEDMFDSENKDKKKKRYLN